MATTDVSGLLPESVSQVLRQGAVIPAHPLALNAQRQLDRIATGWRLKRVAEPVIVNTAAQTPEAILAPKTIPATRLAEARDLGAALAEGIAAGIF